MSHEELLKRITVDPEMMVGQPCIRGMRITVQHILEMLGAGATEEELLEDLPVLESEDIRAAFFYAAQVLDETPIYAVTGKATNASLT
ncbi:MAG: DUF433 domain-containing protein [Armatimonadota bacterium]